MSSQSVRDTGLRDAAHLKRGGILGSLIEPFPLIVYDDMRTKDIAENIRCTLFFLGLFMLY